MLRLTLLAIGIVAGSTTNANVYSGQPDLWLHGMIPIQQSTPTVVQEWKRVDLDHWSILLPQEWTYKPLMGIDSNVGQFVGDGITMTFDSGYYSNPLPELGVAGYEITYEAIDGRPAKIVVAKCAPADVTGVYFREIRTHSTRYPWKLEISGRGLRPTDQTLVVQILRTIRFPTPYVTDTPGPPPSFTPTYPPRLTPRPTATFYPKADTRCRGNIPRAIQSMRNTPSYDHVQLRTVPALHGTHVP